MSKTLIAAAFGAGIGIYPTNAGEADADGFVVAAQGTYCPWGSRGLFQRKQEGE